jgi:hypothetical protein
LVGRYVRLVPLDPSVHGDALWSGAGGPEHADLWTFLTEGPFHDRESFDRALHRKATSPDRLYLAVVGAVWDRKVGFQEWLAPENFDAAGVQKRRLAIKAER